MKKNHMVLYGIIPPNCCMRKSNKRVWIVRCREDLGWTGFING